ncbi:hypothetical protein [Dokdonella sp.]|uniref:hypothetical protein n=1 Tax=Dokdonella sp. TaxID=2291710 RepID=UPI002D7E20B5|nr:hypothetical protein [Dokdonella sp.]
MLTNAIKTSTPIASIIDAKYTASGIVARQTMTMTTTTVSTRHLRGVILIMALLLKPHHGLRHESGEWGPQTASDTRNLQSLSMPASKPQQ